MRPSVRIRSEVLEATNHLVNLLLGGVPRPLSFSGVRSVGEEFLQLLHCKGSDGAQIGWAGLARQPHHLLGGSHGKCPHGIRPSNHLAELFVRGALIQLGRPP